MKYFPLEQIEESVRRLQSTDGKWVLIPLVLGANGVSTTEDVDIQKRFGSDAYLDRFFDGSKIGLKPRSTGDTVNIRPAFSDLERSKPDNLAVVGYRKIWANVYSQSGYRNWRDSGLLEKTTKSIFRLSSNFQGVFEKSIGASFNFEDLLVWAYAFIGFEENISSWQELFDDFLSNHVYGGAFPAEYKNVFRLSGTIPWPKTLLNSRPTNEEFAALLFPSIQEEGLSEKDLQKVYEHLVDLIDANYIGINSSLRKNLAASIVCGFQSTKRVFLMGEPGAGKSELAKLVVASFKAVFDSRVLPIVVSVSETSSPDRFIGFSTIDGSWIPGALTCENEELGRSLLYSKSAGTLPDIARSQINVIVLDEANRRDVESLIDRIQTALDGTSPNPEGDDYRVLLDNSGEKYLSPYTYVIMTGNSPREDSGRLVQSRPFKRRKNLILIPNVIEKTLTSSDSSLFLSDCKLLCQKISGDMPFSSDFWAAVDHSLSESPDKLHSLRAVLLALHKHSAGVSYGLLKKILKTMAARYALTQDFSESLDFGLLDSTFALLSTDTIVEGFSLRETLDELSPSHESVFPHFFHAVRGTLQKGDEFDRVRPFI